MRSFTLFIQICLDASNPHMYPPYSRACCSCTSHHHLTETMQAWLVACIHLDHNIVTGHNIIFVVGTGFFIRVTWSSYTWVPSRKWHLQQGRAKNKEIEWKLFDPVLFAPGIRGATSFKFRQRHGSSSIQLTDHFMKNRWSTSFSREN